MSEKDAQIPESKAQEHTDDLFQVFKTKGPNNLKHALLEAYLETKPEEFNEIVSNLENKTARYTRNVYAERDALGDVKTIYLDDSIFNDTRLFHKPDALMKKGLANAEHENLVKNWDKLINERKQYLFPEPAIIATERLVKTALALPVAERNAVLDRAVELNRNTRMEAYNFHTQQKIPVLQVHYRHPIGDPKTNELSDIRLVYVGEYMNNFATDLYDPPEK